MGATTTEVSAANFDETVGRDGIVVLDWWAPWCGPCRSFGPIFEKVAGKHPDMVFGKVNTENEEDLAKQFEVQSIPTLMIFRDRVLLFAQPGAVPEAALEDLLNQAQALDMDEVRREIAEKKQDLPQA